MIMKYYELDTNEKDLLKALEKGSLKSVPLRPQERATYREYARLTLNKTRNVNIRIPEKDLVKVKARAAEQGIPYQTLLASLVHQYSTGKIQQSS